MILDTIAASTRRRVAEAKRVCPEEKIRRLAADSLAAPPTNLPGFSADSPLKAPFEAALAAPGLSFICEIKKASPSKGVIAEDFPYLDIARAYEKAGAAAISVLTEPEYFLGSDAYLREIAAMVSLPTLRKDFVVDTYQIYEAKVLGAAAVLLICALLEKDALRAYIRAAHAIGLSALVETHTAEEAAAAIDAGARVIGVNNRDLHTFEVDLTTSARLRKMIPKNILFVSESGICGREDVRVLEEIGADAALIGETMMRAPDKADFLARLRGRHDKKDEN
ncbi:MAG: indole-3-glycerol phosphate synthase TrpC [Clostridiales bacterium]|jgi:indole-3-glycerol phosphate synthase|nr:indole-3-glycerol phosphate synthase TrpC [Clostridiales bacterium]